MSLRMPPRLPPGQCESCNHVGALTYSDVADIWWCVERKPCLARQEARVQEVASEIADASHGCEVPEWCGTCADAGEEAAERKAEERLAQQRGEWEP